MVIYAIRQLCGLESSIEGFDYLYCLLFYLFLYLFQFFVSLYGYLCNSSVMWYRILHKRVWLLISICFCFFLNVFLCIYTAIYSIICLSVYVYTDLSFSCTQWCVYIVASGKKSVSWWFELAQFFTREQSETWEQVKWGNIFTCLVVWVHAFFYTFSLFLLLFLMFLHMAAILFCMKAHFSLTRCIFFVFIIIFYISFLVFFFP